MKNLKMMNSDELNNVAYTDSIWLKNLDATKAKLTDELAAIQKELNRREELARKVLQLNELLGEVMRELKEYDDGKLLFVNTATGEVISTLEANSFCDTDSSEETAMVDYLIW